jgi:type III pantothenate kinase
MRPHVVVDIGNSRIKWGLCAPDGAAVQQSAALPDDPAAWQDQLDTWLAQPPLAGNGPLSWALSSVQPQRCEKLRAWAEARGDRAAVLAKAQQLPLQVRVPRPDAVGIDRLLNAVAAKRVLPEGVGAVLIDAGSAVTVDWLDEEHAFRGGAIFPGLRLMAESLHQFTALLPLVRVCDPVPELPATSTPTAMQVGMFLAVLGGAREALGRYEAKAKAPPRVFVTGGDAPLLAAGLGAGPATEPAGPPPLAARLVHWPLQTLEGVLFSAEALP